MVQVGRVVQLGPAPLPLDLAYTLTDAQISETNGNFNNGDHLASVPEQTLSLRAGLIFESGWESYASINTLMKCV